MSLRSRVTQALPERLSWPYVAERIGLGGTRYLRSRSTALGIEIDVALDAPTTSTRLATVTDEIAVAFGAARVRVIPNEGRSDRATVAVDYRRAGDVFQFVPEWNPARMPLDPLRHFSLGEDDYRNPIGSSFYGRHVLIGGSPGAGKSNALRVFMAHLATSRDVACFGIDPKHVELSMWSNRFTSLVVGNEVDPVESMLEGLLHIVQGRATYLASTGTATILPSEEFPWIVLIVDEWAEVAAAGDAKERSKIAGLLRRYVALGRAVGCTAILCTQRPTSDSIDVGTRSLLNERFALQCGDRYQAEAILGTGTYEQSDLIGAVAGRALWTSGGRATPLQFAHVPDEMVPELVCAGLAVSQT